ncbi:MAG: hypothetical protein P8179_23810, partial [Candidatus Thiodiazotropha sp.]
PIPIISKRPFLICFLINGNAINITNYALVNVPIKLRVIVIFEKFPINNPLYIIAVTIGIPMYSSVPALIPCKPNGELRENVVRKPTNTATDRTNSPYVIDLNMT